MYLVIKEWSFWHASTDETPPSSKINPLPAALRRRLNKFGRAAAGMSTDKVQGDPLIVFASRYGDAERSATILQEIARGEDVSPMQFSLSVHNAVSGILSIGWKLKEFQSVISAGEESFLMGVTESLSLLTAYPDKDVLFIYIDLPLPEIFSEFRDTLSVSRASALLMSSSGHEENSDQLVALPSDGASNNNKKGNLLPFKEMEQFLENKINNVSISSEGYGWVFQRNVA